MKFSGNAVLTPEYPADLNPISGPLLALLPGARRQRPSLFEGQQINSQFVFLTFPFGQLVVSNERTSRSADYKHPDETNPTTGVCFFEAEEIALRSSKPAAEGNQLTFVPGDVTNRVPKVGSTETAWIARWTDFSFGKGKLHPSVLKDDGDYVRIVMPGGVVSAGFSHEPITMVDFDYDHDVKPRPIAQEIVLTMTFDDDVESVTLVCTPFARKAETTTLTFTWGGRPSIDLFFGNGSLAALQSVLANTGTAHDHEGDFDVEFDVMLDIIECPPDSHGRQPLPHIRSAEVSHVPCTAAMIALPSAFAASAAAPAAPAAVTSSQSETATAQATATVAPAAVTNQLNATFLRRTSFTEPRTRRTQ